MKFLLKLLGILFLLLILVIVAGGWLVKEEYNRIDELKTPTDTVYNLKKGTGLRTIFHDLFGTDVNSFVFRLWQRLHPELAAVKSGTYEIPADASFAVALDIMVNGKVRNYSIAFIEGGRVRDLIRLMAEDPRLKHDLSLAMSDKDLVELLRLEYASPEGLFMPDTYSFEDGASDLDLLKRAHQEYVEYIEKEYLGRDADLPYKDAYEALIMASIIEKESSVPNERPLVASVFVNRLKAGMKLQTDPTVIYGVGDRYKGRVLKSFLTDKNPYNTYIIDGLPPTPIALASRASIHAALHPAKTEYLFFVASGPDSRKGHVFSRTVREHEQAVKKYRRLVADYKKSVVPASTATNNQEPNPAKTNALDLVESKQNAITTNDKSKEKLENNEVSKISDKIENAKPKAQTPDSKSKGSKVPIDSPKTSKESK